MEPFTRTTISTNSYSSGGGGGGPETWLALLARDGLLSILEPSEPDSLSSWRELDQLFPFGKLGRGIEPPLSLSWHRSVGPSSQAIMAGLDMSALSIAVSAGNIIKVLRAIRSSSTTSPSDDSGTYIFQLMLEIEVATSQINDIAWAPGPLRPQDVIAAACQDSTVRIIDVTSNPANRPQQQQQQSILDITSTSSINSNNNMNPNTLSPTKTRGDTSITTSTKQTPHRRSSAAASISSSSFNNTTQSNTSTGPTPSGIGAGLAGLSRNTLAASSSSFNSTSTSTSASTSTKNGGNLPPSSTGTTDRHRNRNRNEGTIPIRHSWEEVAKLTHGLGDSPEGSDGNNGNNSGNGSVGFGTGPAVRKVVWTYDGEFYLTLPHLTSPYLASPNERHPTLSLSIFLFNFSFFIMILTLSYPTLPYHPSPSPSLLLLLVLAYTIPPNTHPTPCHQIH